MAELEPKTDDRLPSRGVRAFVALFLAAFVVCGVAGIEAWPLTGWRLFSQLRTDHQVAWRATAVGEDGETQIRFAELPRAYRNFPLVMRTFAGLPRVEQTAACQAWLEAARRDQPGTSAVRIYRVDWYLSHRHGSRDGPPVSGFRTWMCAIAAPAFAASTAASAISGGFTGTSSERSVVAPTPVTAQVMKTSVFTGTVTLRRARGEGRPRLQSSVLERCSDLDSQSGEISTPQPGPVGMETIPSTTSWRGSYMPTCHG